MRPDKIAEIAKKANVKKVVLTHYTPTPPKDQNVLDAAVAEIRKDFHGAVQAAHDLNTFSAD
ncbi:hypothetical protein [Sphingomonas sp.]|uniref:hypothetical protein n=1 Tax=Sphingomonas sp. TaxID=28214 RepID=UPI000DB3FA58|nr:hypothetical protein [Sphingomonas sp.]PZU10098.1 MAG: hypothetical protein DI605_05735 [Sphingomonas sp.]